MLGGSPGRFSREVLIIWFAGYRSCRCIRCRLLLLFEHQGMALREFLPDYSLVLPPGIVHLAVVPVEVLDGELQERLPAQDAPFLVVRLVFWGVSFASSR